MRSTLRVKSSLMRAMRSRVGVEPLPGVAHHLSGIFATVYRNLGIDVSSTTVTDTLGRPQPLVEGNAKPIPELS